MSRLILTVPQVPGFDVAGTSLYRYGSGGDYHDFFVGKGDPGRMAVVVGDVAGHDSAANRLMTRARQVLRSHPAVPGQLAELMGEVNRDLARNVRGGRFMTLFLAVLVAATRSIHWVSAGHDGAIGYVPCEDRFVAVPAEDIPLGIDPGWRYREMDHSGWPPGAMMVIATDGVWETRDPGGQMYGKERMMALVRRCRHLPAGDMVTALATDIEVFRQGGPQLDDVTLVVVKTA